MKGKTKEKSLLSVWSKPEKTFDPSIKIGGNLHPN